MKKFNDAKVAGIINTFGAGYGAALTAICVSKKHYAGAAVIGAMSTVCAIAAKESFKHLDESHYALGNDVADFMKTVNGDVEGMTNAFHKLEKEYDNLIENHEDLTEDYDDLWDEYDELYTSYEDLRDRCKMMKEFFSTTPENSAKINEIFDGFEPVPCAINDAANDEEGEEDDE